MKITLNGDSHPLSAARNIADLIAELDLPAPAMLVEHNGLALRREEWAARELADGDRVEVIRIVAGG